jgi:hypothetical protein
MLKYTFVHNCGGCLWEGERVHIRPEVKGRSYFFVPRPMCVEKKIELTLVTVVDE